MSHLLDQYQVKCSFVVCTNILFYSCILNSIRHSRLPFCEVYFSICYSVLNSYLCKYQTGSQPVLELLRQLIERKGCYDPKRLIFLSLSGIHFVAAATSPGVQGKKI